MALDGERLAVADMELTQIEPERHASLADSTDAPCASSLSASSCSEAVGGPITKHPVIDECIGAKRRDGLGAIREPGHAPVMQ